VEDRLVTILNPSGEAGINRIRDAARELAQPLGLKNEFKKLDVLVGALLATHDRDALKTREGKLIAKGTLIDAERLTRAWKFSPRPCAPNRWLIAQQWPSTSRRGLTLRFWKHIFELRRRY
jgi:hypothetical protein